MKKNSTLLLWLLLCFSLNLFAQEVNLQSTYLKNFLLTKNSDLSSGSHTPDIIDINNDGKISVAEAASIQKIQIFTFAPTDDIYNIANDLVHLTNLEDLSINKGTNGPVGTLSHLNLSQNLLLKKLSLNMNLKTLDLSNNLQLEDLVLKHTDLSSLNISNNTKITRLFIRDNQTPLNNVDVSNNLKLESLTINNSGFNTIDVTNNGLLKSLYIDKSPITELNLLNNCNLDRLFCLNTNITSLDARNCNLSYLKLGNTGEGIVPSSTLQKVYLTNQPLDYTPTEGYNFELYNCGNLDFMCIDAAHVSRATTQMKNQEPYIIAITGNNPNCTITTNCDIPQVAGNCNTQTCPIINFPDVNFKNALLNHSPIIDTDGDGEICIDEAESATGLFLHAKNISNLTGLNHFINIETFYYSDNNSTTNINLNNNTKLKYLILRSQPITNLDISNNILLESAEVFNCSLTSLDITNNINLKTLNASQNELTEIDISNNSSLTDVNLQKNKLSNFNITPNNSGLKSIVLYFNQIKEIDIRNCTSVNTIGISDNPLLEKAFLTGNHTFYDSSGSYASFADTVNCPNLKFVCVNNVWFFNTIKELITITWGNPDCTVTTDCSLSDSIPSFDSLFVLGPNPTNGYMYLTRKDPSTIVNSADIYNASTGARVKTIVLNFGNGASTPKTHSTNKLPSSKTAKSPDNGDSTTIDCSDLPAGTYILKVYTTNGNGAPTKTFVKI